MRNATCHPDQPNHGGGFCRRCYQRNYYHGTIGPPGEPTTCGHPDRKSVANGRCSSCHWRATRPMATCHPDRPEVTAYGLCGECYAAKRNEPRLKRQAEKRIADISKLKRLKDIGEPTISEPRWRASTRAHLIRLGTFPTHLTPFADPPSSTEPEARQAWLRAFWAWLPTVDFEGAKQ